MPDLPPDVRDRAARAAQLSDAGGSWIPVWDSFHDENREYWRAVVDAVAEVLAAAEPLGELRIKYADAQARRAFEAETEQNRLRARVDLLTTALTDALEALSWASDYIAVDWPPPYRIENFRAVLSATPTAPVPHTCQLPDIATVREPSRRWDCRVCDARWIAMGRIVGRRSRYEWHQMPVTKTATPTGCRFCGEPESDTVWCCDERMEADGSEAP